MRYSAIVLLALLASSARAADCPAPTTKPTKGTACTDTAFGTNITRASDHTADSEGSTWAVSEYSKRQAFNADESYYFFMSDTGEYWLHNTSTKAKIKKVTATCGGASSNCMVWDAEPFWDHSDPKKLWYIGYLGVYMKLFYRNVDTDSETTVGTFSGGRLPWATATACSTGDEGSPSADSRYWVFACADASWNQLGYFTYDAQTDTILGTLSIGSLGVANSVTMSPSGDYWIGQWYNPTRVRAYTKTMSDWTIVDCGPTHSDTVLGVNGHDYYVGIDWSNYGDANCSSANGYLFSRDIQAGWVSQGYATARTDLLASYSPYNRPIHVSGKAFGLPGKVLVTTACDDADPTCTSLADAALIADVTGSPAPFGVMRINNVRIDYFTSAHCTISRDGSLVMCGSNWRRGSAGTTDMDVYHAETGLTSVFTITTTTLPNGTNGQSYQQDVLTSGGTQPPTACITSAGALPTGAGWSVSGNACRLTDASIETGTYNFTLQATDSNSNTDTQAFTLVVSATLQIDTTTLANGIQNAAYSPCVEASGGTPPRTFSLLAGAVPTGLTLASSGCFTGTATAVGTFNFTARVTDSIPNTDDQALSITITAGAVVTMRAPIIQPAATYAIFRVGALGLDAAADCAAIVKDNGGATVETITSTSGPAVRTLVTSVALSAASTYSATFTCDGATPDATPYPFVTLAAPTGGARAVPLQFGAPYSGLTGAARLTVEYDDNPALSTPATSQNTSCGSGCTVNLSLSAGLYYYRWIWQTAADATLATSTIQPLVVP